MYFHYDFRRQWDNPEIDVAEHPDFDDLQAAQHLNGEMVRLYPDQSRQYTGHRMTSLSSHRTSAELVTIRSLRDLLLLVHDFLVAGIISRRSTTTTFEMKTTVSARIT